MNSAHVTIRFSLQLPDLHLRISYDGTAADYTLVRHLKSAIRLHIPSEHADKALRLIHAGRILEDETSILPIVVASNSQRSIAGGDTLSALSETSSRRSSPFEQAEPDREQKEKGPSKSKSKSKGKERILPTNTSPPQSQSQSQSQQQCSIFLEDPIKTQSRTYIHCSISPTTLTSTQLFLESLPATTPPTINGSLTYKPRTSTTNSISTATIPQGFDRLLSSGSGFTQSDIASLRSQFRSIISSRHTPDTMPDSTTLLRMEERWLDEESFASGRSGSGSGSGSGFGSGFGSGSGSMTGTGTGEAGRQTATNITTSPSDDDESGAATWDALWGVVTGFFWPLGALFWGLRSEGVWSRRRGMAVLAGVGVNLGFAIGRVLS